MVFKLSCLLVFVFSWFVPCLAQKGPRISELMLTEVRRMLENDGLLLSAEMIQKDSYPGYWENPKKREKVVKEYDAFWEQVKAQFKVQGCMENTLRDSLVLNGQSLQLLGGRLFPMGDLRYDFGSERPKYSLPAGYFGLPTAELGSDNSYFNMTSRRFLKFDSRNELEAGLVGARVSASIKAYLAGGTEKAHQISYSCGNFQNILGEVALSIRENETFNAADIKLVRDFWDNSARINQNDSLLVAFNGVCIYSSSSTDTYDAKKVDAALQGGFNALILSAKTENTLNIDRSKRTQSAGEQYKILVYARPHFTPHPTTAQIKASWNRVVRDNAKVIDNGYSLQGKTTETIQIQVENIDSAIYRNLKLDEEYTLQYLKYKGLLNKPKLELEPVSSNRVGVYKLSVTISVNAVYAQEANSDIIKGGTFNLPLRLYYNKIAGRDTLIVFESSEAATVKYQTYPLIEKPIVLFDLIPNSDTSHYYFKGEIPVEVEANDRLRLSNNIILKITKVISDTLPVHPDLTTRLSFPSGKVEEKYEKAYIIPEFKIPKDYLMGRKDMMTMVVELNIKHDKNPLGSRRYATIALPLSESADLQ